MRNIIVFLGAAVLIACSEAVPDRAQSAESAFLAARAGLRNHDLRVYFDALTDSAVRADLANAVMICVARNNPAAVAGGLKQSVGCESILERHGWLGQEAKTPPGYKSAVAKVRDPRGLARELEENHRKYGVGSTFAWEYLDNVKISQIVIQGSRASALAQWDAYEKRPVEFEKDETGWRFNPMLPEI